MYRRRGGVLHNRAAAAAAAVRMLELRDLPCAERMLRSDEPGQDGRYERSLAPPQDRLGLLLGLLDHRRGHLLGLLDHPLDHLVHSALL